MTARAINSWDGFTLAEMLVVLAILALMVTVTLPVLRPRHGDAIDAVAEEIANGLRTARQAAIGKNRDVKFLFDADKRLFRTADAMVTVKVSSDASVEIIGAKSGDVNGDAGFTFFADGSSSGGRIHIGSGSDNRTINVAWLTGLISLTRDAAP